MSAPYSKAKFISSISDGENENDSNAAAIATTAETTEYNPALPATLACSGQEHQPPPVKDACIPLSTLEVT